MAKVKQAITNLAAGFISDANPLEGAPAGATIDESNFHLLPDGTRKKRQDLTTEKDEFGTFIGAAVPAPVGTYPVGSSFLWPSAIEVNGVKRDILLVHQGSFLNAYEVDGHHPLAGKDPLETKVLSVTIQAALISYDKADAASSPLKYSLGTDFCLIVGRFVEPFIIYSTGSSLVVSRMGVQTRTFERLSDAAGITNRPTSLTASHNFNLLSQGWTASDITAFQTHASNTNNVYPSNVDTYDKAKTYPDYILADTRSSLSPNGSMISTLDVFRNAYLPHDNIDFDDKEQVGSGQSIAGSSVTVTISSTTDFVVGELLWYNAYSNDRNYSALCAITSKTGADVTFTWPYPSAEWASSSSTPRVTPVPLIYNTNINNYNIQKERFSTVAVYAGRAWYASVEVAPLSTTIYFSKVISNKKDMTRCYQDADPTSLTNSAPVATDGGQLSITNAGKIHTLVPFNNSLIVIAEQGTWVVTGSRGDVFNALSFQVYQLDNTPCYANASPVEAKGVLFYWTQSGINAVQIDQDGIRQQALSITDSRLQSYITSIGESAQTSIIGRYNHMDDTIMWAFRKDAANYGLDEALLYRPSLNAFFKYTLPSDIIANESGIVDILPLFSAHTSESEAKDSWKFIKRYESSGVYYYISQGFHPDRELVFPSGYLTTWPTDIGDLRSNKKFDGISVAFKITETDYSTDGSGDIQLTPASSCTMQGRFDNDITGTGNKWSSAKEAYRLTRLPFLTGSGSLDLGYSTLVTNNVIRGSGEFVQLHFSSPATKACHLLGWDSIIKTKRRRG